MLRNIFIIGLRNLKRQKGFTFLHLLGLTLGLATCLLVTIYIHHEFSFDKFHEKGDRIVRINQTFIWGDEDALFGSTGPAVKNAIMAEVPEFEDMTRVHTPSPYYVSIAGEENRSSYFQEKNVLAVDPNFLDIFTFPMLAGNPASALSNPMSVVLTESQAQKYFGKTNAIGRQLQLESNGRKELFKVTGLVEDIPQNSHIQFDMLLSMSSFPRVKKSADSWMWTMFVTFGLLQENADLEVVKKKTAAVPGKYLEAFLQKYRGISYEEFLESGQQWDLYVQPFNEIHLKSTNVFSRLNQTTDIQDLYIFMIVGVLILLISVINFVNLATAKASSRAKEVGIRKVIGSEKGKLMLQFITESILYVTFGMLLALTVLSLVLPLFSSVLGVNYENIFFSNPYYIAILPLTILLLGSLAGAYPAFYLSSFRPADVLKGKLSRGMKDGKIRNTLVTVQLTISIGLLAATLIIHQQIEYWKSYDLGFSRDNKIIINNIDRLENEQTFLDALKSYPLIENISYSSDTPPYLHDFDNFIMPGKGEQASVNYLTADEEFANVYDLQVLAGRNLSREYNDSLSIIVNETFARTFGYANIEDLINEKVQYNNIDYKVVGVVNDFNANLSFENYPTAILMNEAPLFRNPSENFTVSLSKEANNEELTNLLASIEKDWNKLEAKSPFNFSFLDQIFLREFKSTINFGNLLVGLTILAIAIACLGLIGLITFIIEKRNKEIGIRKVMGANISQILFLLIANFGKLLIISVLIASPVCYLVMKEWIQNFPFQVDLSIMVFVIAGSLMTLITIAAISFQSVKASRVNPVDYLRNE